MTPTEQIIRDAIEGGCSNDEQHANYILYLPDYAKCQLWIDPEFWRCTGKTRGWNDEETGLCGMPNEVECWEHQWHHFIDHLADGRSIEQALLAISK